MAPNAPGNPVQTLAVQAKKKKKSVGRRQIWRFGEAVTQWGHSDSSSLPRAAGPVWVARVPGRSIQGPALCKGMLWEVPERGREGGSPRDPRVEESSDGSKALQEVKVPCVETPEKTDGGTSLGGGGWEPASPRISV